MLALAQFTSKPMDCTAFVGLVHTATGFCSFMKLGWHEGAQCPTRTMQKAPSICFAAQLHVCPLKLGTQGTQGVGNECPYPSIFESCLNVETPCLFCLPSTSHECLGLPEAAWSGHCCFQQASLGFKSCPTNLKAGVLGTLLPSQACCLTPSGGSGRPSRLQLPRICKRWQTDRKEGHCNLKDF